MWGKEKLNAKTNALLMRTIKLIMFKEMRFFFPPTVLIHASSLATAFSNSWQLISASMQILV